MIRMIGRYEVKVLGRTVEDGGALWLVSSLSGIGFRVRDARYLKMKLLADDSVSDPARAHQTPRWCAMVEDDVVLDRRMEKREETIDVFDSRIPWSTEVRLRKLSEGTQSLMAVKEIQTDGVIEPLEEKAMKIEFIGDSITCGYGVDAKNGLETFSTATENAGKSFAGLVSAWMNADAMLTAFSGHGIVSGYTGDPEKRNIQELVPPYYEAVGRNGFILPSGRTVTEIPWDFSQWQPDRIVINLGTNDLSWIKNREPRKEMYRKQYKDFLHQVRRNNPGAMLLCVLGVMGTGLNEYMVRAVNEYRAETGDLRIHCMTAEEQDGRVNGYGADFHPSEKTQRKLAEKVQALIQNT